MSQYFLGVDGGQSGTRAVIGDETGRVLGAGSAGPSNSPGEAEGLGKFVIAVRGCIRGASKQAGLDANTVRFASAYLGLSGGPADKASILPQIVPADRTFVTHDAAIALAGATAGQPGIVVIAGSGSIAFGRNVEGCTARAGGWGYLFGDEGSAFWIAREAMRAALRWEEGWGVPTSLRARLLDATGARNLNDLLHRCYTPEFARPRVADLARMVHHAAEQGDLKALEILDAAARELALLALAVRGQLFPGRKPALTSYSGGVFRSRIVLNRFRDWIMSEAGVQVMPPVYEPVIGALLGSYAAAGLSIGGVQGLKQEYSV
jgi:N-acetylglucosamine kinase-like BadF-type ATPase